MAKHSIKGEREKKKKKKLKKDMNLDEAFMTMFSELILQQTSSMEYKKQIGAAGLIYKCHFTLTGVEDKDGVPIKLNEIKATVKKILEKEKNEAQNQTEGPKQEDFNSTPREDAEGI